jgi:peptidoglycan/xylan/chitin deacetylase (PgdA/CDA1 family)
MVQVSARGAIRQVGSLSSLKPVVKRGLRRLAARGYCRSPLPARIHRGKVAILMYHRILADDDVACETGQPGLYVRVSTFRRHLEWLRKYYEIIPLAGLLAAPDLLPGGGRKSYCIITFDDGWLDNYRHAFPLLRQFGVPATIFVPTAYIGTTARFWFEKMAILLSSHFSKSLQFLATADRDLFEPVAEMAGAAVADNCCPRQLLEEIMERIKKKGEARGAELIDALWSILEVDANPERVILDWQEMEEMSRYGISFGSHTVHHRLLTCLSPAAMEAELRESKEILEGSGVNHLPVFSYPNGDYDHTVREMVRKCGYQAAVTTRYGVEALPPNNPFELGRIGIHDDISRTAQLFALRLGFKF